MYRNFRWDGPLRFVKKAAGLSDRVLDDRGAFEGDDTLAQWFGARED